MFKLDDTFSVKIIATTVLWLLLSVFSFSQSQSPDSIKSTKYQGILARDDAKMKENLDKLTLSRKANSLKEVSKYYNAIAQLYHVNKAYRYAVETYTLSIAINEDLGNEHAIAGIQNIIGVVYAEDLKYEESITFFDKALRYFTKKRLKQDVINTRINLSLNYSNLDNYSEAIRQLDFAFAIAQEISDAERISSTAGLLSQAHEKNGNQERAHFYFRFYEAFHGMQEQQKAQKLQKSIKEMQLQQQLNEAEARNQELELYKRERELSKKNMIIIEKDSLNKDLYGKYSTEKELKELLEQSNHRQKIILEQKDMILKSEQRIRWILIGALFIMVVMLLVVAYFFRENRLANRRLAEQNVEILNQQGVIVTQKNKIEESFNVLQTKNEEIVAGNKFAQIVQTSVLLPTNNLQTILSDSFVLFKPKDVVSGDFPWFARTDEKIFVAAVDCTGHGTSGGLLTILGFTLLNSFIKQGLEEPAEILEKLNDEIENIFVGKDVAFGMDLSLCAIDFGHKTLTFAGAQNPLIVVQNGVQTVYKGTRRSIAGFHKKVPFTQTDIPLTDSAWVYMYSDGMKDQSGGERNRKMGPKRLNETLLSIAHLSAIDQNEALEKSLAAWQGKNKQVDDIIVMGVKVDL